MITSLTFWLKLEGVIITDDNQKQTRYVIASISYSDIEAYFNVRFAGTKRHTALTKILNRLTPSDIEKIAKAMGDEYKTDFYWGNLEYHFIRMFVHGDS